MNVIHNNKKSAWPFEDRKDVGVLTVQQILDGNQPILRVTHDIDDGMWQFLIGGKTKIDDARLVSLEYIFTLDPSIAELADLPLGWAATRLNKKDKWSRLQIR